MSSRKDLYYFPAMRNELFTGDEHKIMTAIGSFSKECRMSLLSLSKTLLHVESRTPKSTRTVKRILKRLREMGMIDCWYVAFKKLRIRMSAKGKAIMMIEKTSEKEKVAKNTSGQACPPKRDRWVLFNREVNKEIKTIIYPEFKDDGKPDPRSDKIPEAAKKMLDKFHNR